MNDTRAGTVTSALPVIALSPASKIGSPARGTTCSTPGGRFAAIKYRTAVSQCGQFGIPYNLKNNSGILPLLLVQSHHSKHPRLRRQTTVSAVRCKGNE